MKSYRILMVLLVAFTPLANAKQIKEVEQDGEIEAFISADELSRIKVIDDRVKSVKANQGDMELLEDNNLGEIYLRPTKSNKAPVNMFITTEKGNTYKLLLLPKKIPSEQIFIKNKKQLTEASGRTAIVHLIQDMRAGRESPGFSKKIADDVIDIDDNKYHKSTIYKGSCMVGEILEFYNDNEENFIITPSIFNHLKVKALSIDKSELSPGDSTFIYLVKEVNNG